MKSKDGFENMGDFARLMKKIETLNFLADSISKKAGCSKDKVFELTASLAIGRIGMEEFFRELGLTDRFGKDTEVKG